MNKKRSVSSDYKGFNAMLIVAFILIVALLNIIVFALSERYEWFIYREESYSHTIGEAADDLFAEEEQKEVEIIFCMEEDELTSDVVYDLVWQTSQQIAEKFDFVTVDTVNIYLQPSRVSPYKYTTYEDGTEVRNTINTSSVIFVCGDQFRVETLSSFFILDGEGYINSYNGEEYMLSCIKWVQTENHPIAYFTNTHGENYSGMLSFYNILTASGYDVRMLDLSADKIDDRASLIIISNPIYDIERAAEGSGIISEAEQLEAFCERGGTLFVSIDPYIKSSLTQLRAFLSDWGMDTDPSIIMDTENSITHDGYTLVARYAETGAGAEIAERVQSFNTAQTILRDASPITVTEKDGIETSVVISSYPTTKSYYNGQLYSDAGNFPILALSERAGGDTGRVILCSGAYLLANDVLNSKVYSNRELVFALLERSGAEYAVIGAEVLPISSTLLEGLTTGDSRVYAIMLVGVVPLLIAAAGIVILTKRKNR